MKYDWLDRWKDVGRKVNHSSFDLSKRIAITQPCSLLTPTLCFETVPNEQHKIKLDGILRSDTLNTAAFVNGTIHTNVFFVPYKQLWHPFNDLVSQKHDPHSSIFKDSKYAPNVLLSDVLDLIHAEDKKGTGAIKSMFDIPWHLNALRLLHYLKYGNFYSILGMDDSTYYSFLNSLNGYDEEFHEYKHPRYVNMWRFLAYQHIFYDYYRNKYFDQSPWMGHSDTPASESSQGAFSYVGTFNVDDLPCADVASSHFDGSNTSPYGADGNVVRLRQMLDMHYSQYKKDIYTSALPSTQFGAVSSLSIKDINIDTVEDDGWSASNMSAYVAVNSSTLKSDLAFSESKDGESKLAHNWAILNAFDVLQFRKAELLQQWKQNALRAGNQVDDNFESHYGVKPYYEEDNVVRHLGSFSCHWDINPITATASTGDSVNGNVGDLAAIGVGQTVGDEITFECKDFGVVMAISSFVPDVYYDANGLDKANTLIEPFDYFYPEFQNIGFEPLGFLQQDIFGATLASEGAGDVNLGFVPPYSWYKTNVDEVFGDFANSIYEPSSAIGGMSGWILKRHDSPVFVDGVHVGMRSLEQFYINPKTDDILFQDLNYNGKPSTDHFAQALTWTIHSIRPMSMLGLPIFG